MRIIVLLLLLISFIFVTPVLASVTLNSTSTSDAYNGSGFSWSHTVNSGNNLAMFVLYASVSEYYPGDEQTGILYNGDSFTKMGCYGNSDYLNVCAWYLIAPDVGTYTVSTTGTNVNTRKFYTYVLNDVGQTSSTLVRQFSSSTNTDYYLPSSTVSGNMILDVISQPDIDPGNADSGQIKLRSSCQNSHCGASSYRLADGSSQYMGWTSGGSTGQRHYVLELSQFSSGESVQSTSSFPILLQNSSSIVFGTILSIIIMVLMVL